MQLLRETCVAILCVIQITGTGGEFAQGNNHKEVATTELGDLPDIPHWDGCAQIDKSKNVTQ